MKSKEVRLHPERLDFKTYQQGRNNGIAEFAIFEDGLILKYHDRNDYYLYNYRRPGKLHVNQMKQAALNLKGLNTYINRHVRDKYDDKWINAVHLLTE